MIMRSLPTMSCTRIAALCTVLVPALAAQSAPDPARARQLEATWRGQLVEFRPEIHWLPGGKGLWFRRSMPGGGNECVAVDAATGERRIVADPGADAEASLPPREERGRSRNGGEPTRITFHNRTNQRVRLFWLDSSGVPRPYGELAPGERKPMDTFAGHLWLGDFAPDDLAGLFRAETGGGLAVFDAASRLAAMRGAMRPGPRPYRVFVKGCDLWAAGADGGEFRLSRDGTPDDPYRENLWFSPDGTKVLAMQVAPPQERKVTVVESAPKDQVQPRVQTYDYLKPGDRIARPRPRLFDLGARRQIAVDDAPWADAWSIDRVHWSPDGEQVFCLYNRRGHQLLALRAIAATTGAVRDVVTESSPTFVDYSQKTFLHWLDAAGQVLWASERDGWNHLYRFDTRTGALVNQVTKGEWVVRGVERVDVAKQQIWFTAYGIRPGQDPYYAHLARVDFDGRNLTVLTAADGTHTWTFSPDHTLLLDRWSRVDQPWVTEVRRSSDGALVCELGRDDAARMLAAGFRPPERFSARGRDGTTAIHGILVRPSDFDPARRYPVIEDIYAGPHDHFVPKAWGLGMRQRALAELGFVVVQIDGMGTNWRSRAFHDVCWKNLKDSGFPDRIAWLRAAAAAHPELDLTRVGIYGGSAGGQSALAALLHHGDFYVAAAADCGCHDNRMDKIWWNEAWMGWPVGPEYADNSNVTHAKQLRGRLLLTVGELDHNVDPASTLQVVSALVAADKDFEFLLVPGAGHGIGESPYLVRRRQDFFVRAFLAGR